MEKIHTHYDNLKVTKNAPLEVIKAAYRAMAQKYHPDINVSPASNNTMRLINEAWEVLSDPVKRIEHDKWIAEEEKKLKNTFSYSTDSKEHIFENENFKFHFQSPLHSRRPFKNKNYGVDGHRDKPVGRVQSKIVTLNAWLGKTHVKLKAIALLTAIAFSSFIWLSGGIFHPEKETEESSLSVTGVSEQPTNGELFEGLTGAALPVSESTEKNKPGKVNAPKSFSSQGEIDKGLNSNNSALAPEHQEETGYLTGAYLQGPAGLSSITVDNQRGGANAIARIYLNGAKPPVRSMYIKVGETFIAESLAPGNYVFRYKFIGNKKIYEADQIFTLEEINTVNGTSYSNLTVTLFTVNNGNLRTKEVPEDRF